MSRRLQDLFWDVELTPTEQLVAQRLAWHADDEAGKCWPGIATLCAKTGLSERGVQKAIQSLKAAGHITREEARGLGVVYFVHPRTACTPAEGRKGEPAQDSNFGGETPEHGVGDAAGQGANKVHPRTKRTPAPRAATPAPRAPKEVKKPSDDKHGDASAAERVQAMTDPRGRRIDVDWQPTLPLPDSEAKIVAGWPPGRLEEELIEFRDFWLSEAGQRAVKRDWDRTWWNRLRAVSKYDKRRDEGKRGHGKRHHDRPSGWAPRPGMEGAEPAFLHD
jgi:hypothetical protein